MVDTLSRGGLCTTASCSRKLPNTSVYFTSKIVTAGLPRQRYLVLGSWAMPLLSRETLTKHSMLQSVSSNFWTGAWILLMQENYQLFRKPRIDANQAAGLKLEQVNVGY